MQQKKIINFRCTFEEIFLYFKSINYYFCILWMKWGRDIEEETLNFKEQKDKVPSDLLVNFLHSFVEEKVGTR